MKKRVLLVYPKFPDTYWGFKHSLRFIGKKANFPPLGLLTVAALLPDNYELKLIDMNVTELKIKDIIQADLIMISAMIIQKESFEKLVQLCNRYNKPVVAGGPYPTSSYQDITGVDYFVLNEAEITLPEFLGDFEKGIAKKVYTSEVKPDIINTPIPRIDLINLNSYSSMALQFSRGCPFNCEFCDIIELFGRIPRTKLPEQFLSEVETIYQSGYRGSVFIVDDNFIGNIANVKKLLPFIIRWQKERKYPFLFYTEASVNLAHDEELMDLMAEAGFTMVFLGIETPVQESLKLTHKTQNVKMDLLESVLKIQNKGIEVTAGFIIGFDSDPENISDIQFEFIQKSGIPLAMIGLLTALPNTQLYRRLKSENRLLQESSGNNTLNLELNFKPAMETEKLIKEYEKVISKIYRPKYYFDRCLTLIKNLPQNSRVGVNITKLSDKIIYLWAFIQSLVKQTFSSYGFYYLKFLLYSLFHKPKLFPKSVQLAIFGYHFFKLTKIEIIQKSEAINNFKLLLENVLSHLNKKANKPAILDIKGSFKELLVIKESILQKIIENYNRIYKNSNDSTHNLFKQFNTNIKKYISDISFSIKKQIENINKSKLSKTMQELDYYRRLLLDKFLTYNLDSGNETHDLLLDIRNSLNETMIEIEKLLHNKVKLIKNDI